MKPFFLASLFFLFTLSLSAQRSKISTGFRAGTSLSHIVDASIRPSEWHKLGLSGGLQLTYHFVDSWNLEMALLYTQKGIKNQQVKLTNSYLELPLRIAYFSGLPDDSYRIKFLTGGYFAQLLNSSDAPKDFYEKQDYGWLVGVGFKKNTDVFHDLQLELSYQKGWKDISTDPNNSFKNTVWTLHLIYNFAISK